MACPANNKTYYIAAVQEKGKKEFNRTCISGLDVGLYKNLIDTESHFKSERSIEKHSRWCYDN